MCLSDIEPNQGAMIQVCDHIMREKEAIIAAWELDAEDVNTVVNKIPPEKLESSLVTINIYLHHLFPQVEVRNNWMRKPNGAFSSKRPIDLILKDGELGLDTVEKYLAGAMQR